MVDQEVPVAHPPWLRFQAYFVGLPKTGSTSIFAVFANYRAAHEYRLMELARWGVARRRGELSDVQFLAACGDRLVPPRLELDSTTTHHLYPEVLAETFPTARFIHAVRDVGSWVGSALDMMLRKKLARRYLELPFAQWEANYQREVTGEPYYLQADLTDDYRAIAHMMRFWAAHMRDIPRLLPPSRLLQLRTRDIGSSLDQLADFVDIPVASLRPELTEMNLAPLRFDRFAAGITPEIRATYLEHCAAPMAQWFPDEHQGWLARLAEPLSPPGLALAGRPDWEQYLRELGDWVADAAIKHGPKIAH